MVITGVPPVLLGRVKMKLAEELHDKVLYADADMNKADWMTALGSIIGVTGIGLGLWWLDAVAALFISLTILSDGMKNMRSAILDLMDARADHLRRRAAASGDRRDRGLPARAWTGWPTPGVRVRDEGHVFHVGGLRGAAEAGGSSWPSWRRPGPAAPSWTGGCTTSCSCRCASCRGTSSSAAATRPQATASSSARGWRPGWPGPPR